MKIARPRTIEAATALLDRFVQLDGQRASIEAERNAGIAGINAAADAALTPILTELAAISAAVEPWWTGGAGLKLTEGKRKSIELGGCMIGTVKARDTLAHSFDDDDQAVDALRALPWAKPMVRVKFSLDRSAILGALDGRRAGDLAGLGFARASGAETFFVKPVAQGGTIGTSR